MPKTLKDLEQEYDLELDRAIKEIKAIKKKSPKVVLQFPDGMKQVSTEIADYLETETKANIVIWLGTCFGACDTPKTDADLIIQFGHAPWEK